MLAHMWRNWVGNQSCEPARTASPESEDEVSDLVAGAARDGLGVRVAAAGHSFTPVVVTDGLLLDLTRLPRIRSVDTDRRRVVVGPATTIGEFGEPLWAVGLGLANQGDIIAQQIAGAISTATPGPGPQRRRVSSPGGGARELTRPRPFAGGRRTRARPSPRG